MMVVDDLRTFAEQDRGHRSCGPLTLAKLSSSIPRLQNKGFFNFANSDAPSQSVRIAICSGCESADAAQLSSGVKEVMRGDIADSIGPSPDRFRGSFLRRDDHFGVRFDPVRGRKGGKRAQPLLAPQSLPQKQFLETS
jgi:hypothetical protein